MAAAALATGAGAALAAGFAGAGFGASFFSGNAVGLAVPMTVAGEFLSTSLLAVLNVSSFGEAI